MLKWAGATAVVAGIAVPFAAAADGFPEPVLSVAVMLKAEGYVDVAVGPRVFGGYVIQARDGDTFALLTIMPDGVTLGSAELFRDGNSDGIFSNDEALHPNEAADLFSQVRQTLSGPAPQDPEMPVELGLEQTRIMPGFEQRMAPLFAGASIRTDAAERLGSATVTTLSTLTERVETREGFNLQSFRKTENTAFFGLSERHATASVTEPGGVRGSFGPLSMNGQDADTIRTTAIANSPDAESMRQSLTAAGPDAEALTAGILAAVPTAESIRATVVAPVP